MSSQQKGFGIMGLIVTIVSIALISSLGWLFWQNVINKPTSSPESSTAATEPAAAQQKTDDPAVPKQKAPLPPTAPRAE